ncbi:MAG: hypothetical protein ACK4UO_15025 [Pseudolabrys sp.]
MRKLALVTLIASAAVGVLSMVETASAQVGIYIGPPRYEYDYPPPPPRRYRRGYEYYYDDYGPPPRRYYGRPDRYYGPPPRRERYSPPRNGRCPAGHTIQDGLCKPYRGY